MDKPLVSVCIITYNHAEYIEQAIDSVLMQQVDFPWEIIIADDCSTDGTREIIQSYKAEHPDLIKHISRKKNVGAGLNFIELIKSAKGKYIAYLEGDDYWIDPYKLDKQVAILENNDNLICTLSNANILINENFNRLYTNFKNGLLLKLEFLSIMNFHTSSLCMRNIFKDIDILKLEKYPYDSILFMFLFERGEFYYLDSVLSAYRINLKSTWNSQSLIEKYNQSLKTQNYIKTNFYLTSVEKKQVALNIIGIKLNRIKIFANEFNFNSIYRSDLKNIIYHKLTRNKFKLSFVLYSIFPDNYFNLMKKYLKP